MLIFQALNKNKKFAKGGEVGFTKNDLDNGKAFSFEGWDEVNESPIEMDIKVSKLGRESYFIMFNNKGVGSYYTYKSFLNKVKTLIEKHKLELVESYAKGGEADQSNIDSLLKYLSSKEDGKKQLKVYQEDINNDGGNELEIHVWVGYLNWKGGTYGVYTRSYSIHPYRKNVYDIMPEVIEFSVRTKDHKELIGKFAFKRPTLNSIKKIIKISNKEYAKGGEAGGIKIYVDNNNEVIKTLNSLEEAKKWVLKNKRYHETIVIEDEKLDTIVVDKKDSPSDIEWLFNPTYAKGGEMNGSLDTKFEELEWRDTTEAYYGLDFTPFMTVVEEYYGYDTKGLDKHFEKLGWRDTTEAYYGLDMTPFMSAIEEFAENKSDYAKGGEVSEKRKYVAEYFADTEQNAEETMGMTHQEQVDWYLKNIVKTDSDAENYGEEYMLSHITGKEYAEGGRVRVKDTEITVGEKFTLQNGDKIEIIRLFTENIDEDWVEYSRKNKNSEVDNTQYGDNLEGSVKSLRMFINRVNGWSYEEGGEIRRFDRHAYMSSKTRGEILDMTHYPIMDEYFVEENGVSKYERIKKELEKEGVSTDSVQNYLFGLFDGYDYSQTDNFKEQFAKIKKVDEEFYNRVMKIYEEVSKYPEGATQVHAEGGTPQPKYKVGQKVYYTPKLSGFNNSKPLIVEHSTYKKSDELEKSFGMSDEPHYLYHFKDSSLASRESNLSASKPKKKMKEGGKITDIVDDLNRMYLPTDVYLNGEKYTGNAVFINGYNGYTSTKDDGVLCAVVKDSAWNRKNIPNYLTDKDGVQLRAKSRRGQRLVIENKAKKKAEGGEMTSTQKEKIDKLYDTYSSKDKDYFGYKRLTETQVGNWKRAIEKGDEGAKKYTEAIIRDIMKENERTQFDTLVEDVRKMIQNRDVEKMKSRIRYDQKLTLKLYEIFTGVKIEGRNNKHLRQYLDETYK